VAPRVALVAGMALALLALAAPAGAEARKAERFTVKLPSAGRIAIQSTRVTVRRRAGRALPRRVRLRPVRRRAIPRSAGLLWATRVIRRRRSVTYAALVVAVNRSRRRTAGAAQEQPAEVSLRFKSSPFLPDGLGDVRQIRLADVQGAPRSKLQVLTNIVDDDWEIGARSVFHPIAEPKADPEMGIVDAAGLFVTRPRDLLAVWYAIGIATAKRFEGTEIGARIENQLGLDVDGDGDLGAPDCGEGTYTSPLREITVPPVRVLVNFETPIPNSSYYTPRNGYVSGGCDFFGDIDRANVEVLSEEGERIAWNYDNPPPGEDDRLQDGRYCPVVEFDAPSSRCRIFAPQIGFRPVDGRVPKTYRVAVAIQNSRADQAGSRHRIRVRVSWTDLQN
jgi:hypothetical protein